MQRSGRMACGVLAAVVPMGLVALVGCGTSVSPIVNQILDSQIRQQLGILPSETATVQIINTTESTIELDLLVDNISVTITCTAEEGRCAYTPTACPQTIKAVQERRFTAEGVYTGGRFFNDNAAFVFTSTEFSCQSVIVFTFAEDTTAAQVL